jgi:hypothetical protein
MLKSFLFFHKDRIVNLSFCEKYKLILFDKILIYNDCFQSRKKKVFPNEVYSLFYELFLLTR